MLKRNNDSGFFLPIQPFWDGNKLYLTKNYSQLKELNLACEIVSINGLLSKDLIESMLNKMMRDGNNFQYPIWVLNSYFFEYYSYFFGCNKNYQLVVKEEDKDKLIEVEGIPKSELFQRINEQKKIPEKGISFEILEANSTAILNIKDWHNDVLRKYYHQKFKPEIKNIIQQIEHSNIENLIIDVRNNQGGDLINSKFLLSYLLNEPFVIVEKYYKNKKGKIIESRGPQIGIHKPLPVTFKGKVYVLINGGSFSNSSIFCSVLKKHKRAIFIGEETGGSEFLICGITKTFQLPNSNVTIELPKLKFLIKDYKHKELHGITPDFPKKPTVESLINGKDIILEYAIKLINENSSQFNK